MNTEYNINLPPQKPLDSSIELTKKVERATNIICFIDGILHQKWLIDETLWSTTFKYNYTRNYEEWREVPSFSRQQKVENSKKSH